jgi:DNA-binding XRE family transcriptional regulator
MQAHVKTPLIKINIKGEVHPKVLSVLKEVYGEKLELIEDEDDEFVDAFETDWFKKVSTRLTPAKNIRIYREIHGMTQEELGEKLGGVPRQNISYMERGRRPVSKSIAKKLAEIFDVSVENFI